MLNLFIALRTNKSKPFFLPFDVEVTKYPDFVFNRPPYFAEVEGYTLNYMIASDNSTYSFRFNLTETLDDHSNLTWLNVSSRSLGRLKVKYDSQTQETSNYYQNNGLLSYDSDTYELKLDISGGVPGIMRYIGGIYEIKVLLMDH